MSFYILHTYIMNNLILDALHDAQTVLNNLIANENVIAKVEQASELLVQCLQKNGHVYSCGNGGSLCDATHFAEELSGKFRNPRAPLAATVISDPAHITCVGNDFGFEYIFSRFIEASGKKGDLLFCLSTSGESLNIIKAIEAAHSIGMQVIALTGKPKASVTSLADVTIVTETNTPYSDRIQELHIKIIHILIELVEKKLFNT